MWGKWASKPSKVSDGTLPDTLTAATTQTADLSQEYP